MTLLSLDGISRSYGGLQALTNVTAQVNTGEVLGLIGPNGAGKTTLFNIITGFDQPAAGRVQFASNDITNWPAYRRARAGIGRTFQNLRLFNGLTVMDHVILGQHTYTRVSLIEAALSLPRLARQEAEMSKRGLEYLQLVGLGDRLDQLARNLPYGLQRRLEIARALALRPQLLLLDEPLTGMTPEEKREIVDLIRQIRSLDITIFLIDHDMRALMSVVERVIVLNFGQIIAAGSPAEVQDNPQVIEAYLGEVLEADEL